MTLFCQHKEPTERKWVRLSCKNLTLGTTDYCKRHQPKNKSEPDEKKELRKNENHLQ